MTASLIQQAQGLKAMLEQVKQQSLISKDHALQQLRAHMEKEKQEVWNEQDSGNKLYYAPTASNTAEGTYTFAVRPDI